MGKPYALATQPASPEAKKEGTPSSDITMQTSSICWRSGISLRNRVTVALVRVGSNPMMVPAHTLVKIHRCEAFEEQLVDAEPAWGLENVSLLSFGDVQKPLTKSVNASMLET